MYDESSLPGSVMNWAIRKTKEDAVISDDRSIAMCWESSGEMYRAPWEVDETSLIARGAFASPLNEDKGTANSPFRPRVLCASK